MRSRLVGSAVFWPVLWVWLGSTAGAGILPEPVRAEDLPGGLAVHLGTTDGQIEIDLARGGRILVHGLALDAKSVAAARARIEAAGVYGLVSVERADSLRTLPYAANLVNVLVADADALGDAAPTEAEILHVVAPGGIACLKRGGRWTRPTSRPACRESTRSSGGRGFPTAQTSGRRPRP